MTTIFLAEDDPTMVALLKTLLKLEGFKVQEVDTSTGNLLQVLKEMLPKILLLDVNLPNENGIDVVRKMREDEAFEQTTVIMVSGMSLEEKCLESGANDFLLKPYMPDDLVSIIRKYV